MSEKIIFVSEEKIGVTDGSNVTYLNSQYLEKYNKTRLDIKNKSSWKTEGKGAMFMGVHNALQNFEPERTVARINGISLLSGSEKIIYTISINEMSGVFIKNPVDNSELEGHVIHKNNIEFLNMDFNSHNDQLAVSIRENSVEAHLALLDIKKSSYNYITEGESIDENPVWSKTNNRVIYYNSAGIALDPAKQQISVGPRHICRLDLDAGTMDEVVSDEKYDYIKPKEDGDGNLYFIRKLYREKVKSGFAIMDILLFPFRLVKAIFGWLNFFTMRYSGESLNSRGNNPAKMKEKNPQEIFVEGNLVNAEKALQENKNSGEKYPGIAPRSWELMKMGPDGKIVSLKKGVLDYDINCKGEIVYSNGAYLIKIMENKKEEMLGKARLASKVKFV